LPKLSEFTEIEFPPTSPFSEVAKHALAQVDSLHISRKIVPLAIRPMSAARVRNGLNGLYLGDSESAVIELNTRATEPHITLLHEVGHFLDNFILHSIRKTWASHYDQDLEPLIEACLDSRPIRAIKKRLSPRHSFSRQDRAQMREALLLHELFARAYAQWVVTKSNSLVCDEELRRRITIPRFYSGVPIYLQWDPAEFKGIMLHVDDLFRKKGLL
jgi:hypothetical protein